MPLRLLKFALSKRYPEPRMFRAPQRLRDRYDVVIIGGGGHGLAAAYYLARRGVQVVLLEANRIGWGASGRNGGQIIGGYGGPLSSNPEKANRLLGEGAGQVLNSMGLECVDIIR